MAGASWLEKDLMLSDRRHVLPDCISWVAMRLSGSDGRRLTYRTSPRVRASLLLLGAIVLLVYFAETLFVVCRGSMDSRAVRHAIPSGKGLRAKPFVPSRSGVAPSSGLRVS